MIANENQVLTRFIAWLDQQVIANARGDDTDAMEREPRNKLWLGRLDSEESVIASSLGERGERLTPCATGLRVLPQAQTNITFEAVVSCRCWLRLKDKTWTKTEAINETIAIDVPDLGTLSHGHDQLAAALGTVIGASGLSCTIRTELEETLDGHRELTILLVNTSPKEHDKIADTTIYECTLAVRGLARRPYFLEGLPDSFRYDRRVEAYGINGGFKLCNDELITTDTVVVERARPTYWSHAAPQPDFRFDTLASDPIPSLADLASALKEWGDSAWSKTALDIRAKQEDWSAEMRNEADLAATEYQKELARVQLGVALIQTHADLRLAFMHMNLALKHSSRGRYDGWRPFQIGFLLANIACLVDDADTKIVDVVWFATGGGKTETYLGLVVTAALLDRMRGKRSGITAWSRFPLRMLSLQQTQRFADAMAGAELERQALDLGGDPFSVGFLVGQGATPNSIKSKIQPGDKDPDPDDPQMPSKYRVLLRCPFCGSEKLSMGFNRKSWRLEHRCERRTATMPDERCPWQESGLPFYIVDDEIYRFLPTVIVGTLDKAASIALQTSMRGLVGPPWGKCRRPGHGFTYATRANRPSGCLVPDCPEKEALAVEQATSLFPPTLRLQDELHLLKDALGAVDAHYEALFDHLQLALSGTTAKILGSSATLTGYEKQVDVLYGREGRVFPVPGPRANLGFWTSDSDAIARRYVALAPRGTTIEYAIDQTATALQRAIRDLVSDPASVCRGIGIDPSWAPRLIELYGVDVVYGNTLRDLEAVARSFETQIRVAGQVHHASLTGRTDFDEVRTILQRLDVPEPDFADRLHLITASSMMSHGVDIDRLNIMAMMGMPLTTAEFIQTSARVGRRYPGLVFVMLKMARERDAGIFRSFESFVMQGDRFVEPVPITRRSRRVLDHTLPGLFFARIRHIHEPQADGALTTVARLRAYYKEGKLSLDTEYEALCDALDLNEALDEQMRQDVYKWLELYFEALDRLDGSKKWPSDLSPTGEPMTSLRDVEEQAPIVGLVKQ